MIKKLQLQVLKKLPGVDAQFKMAPPIRGKKPIIPDDVRQSAVCILLYEKDKEWCTLLIQRTQDGGTHSGQISFPGGRFDAEDINLTYTALRECEEEIGIPMNAIKVLGHLTPLYIPPSNFMVTPVLCTLETLPTLILSTQEVAQVFSFSLQELFDNKLKKNVEVRQSDQKELKMITPSYQTQRKTIWGATAMILAELEEIYKQVI
jgi:8-oxo-dGTP pyrophosphatase MutT (NUDIX family)